MLKMSTVSISNALTGTVPGVSTIQTSGRPGDDQAKIFIRGITTWQNTDPLVLVDGIERNWNDIDPNEIETLSVLKDASATAVFGVRGANGVILITTKRGEKGKVKVNATSEVIAKQPINIPKPLSSYQTALAWNDAVRNNNDWGSMFSDEILEHYRLQDLPYIYPSTDWQALMLKNAGWSHKYNVNISGGTDFARIFASVSYLHDGDIINTIKQPDYDPSYKYDRFNYRFNIDIDITQTTILTLSAGGYTGIENRPFETNAHNIWRGILHLGPMAGVPFYPADIVAQYPDSDHPDPQETGWRLGETFLHNNALSPYNSTNFSGQRLIKATDVNYNIQLKQNLDFIVKGLSLQGKAAYSWDMKFRRNWQYDAITWKLLPDGTWYRGKGRKVNTAEESPVSPVEYNDSGRDGNLNRNWYFEGSVNYDYTFKKHTVGALLLGYRQKKQTNTDFPRFEEGLVGRITYDFGSRYLLESNIGYNGSEQFAPKNRYGFFPSFALGWNLHNESFFTSFTKIISRAKFRASHGEVGSDASNIASNRWLYTSAWVNQTSAPYSTNSNYWPGFSSNNSYSAPIIEESAANTDARWEKAIKQDVGIELSFLKNMMFTFSADFFRETRTQILIDRQQIPSMFGVGMKRMNLGEAKTKGYEIDLKYQQTSGNLYWWLKPMISFSDNRIINRDEPDQLPDYQKQAGHRIHQSFGYILQPERLIQNADMQMNTVRNGNSIMGMGDARWIDFNGDGIIDENDQVTIGYSRNYPLYNYSFSGGIKYGNIEFDFIIQASSHYNKWTQDGMAWPLHRLSPHIFPHQLNYWTPDNRNAFYPSIHREDRYLAHNAWGLDFNNSFQIWDASYIRLRSANIIYHLPKNLFNKSIPGNFSVYLRGNNLLTLKRLPFDPELSQNESNQLGSGNYPILRRFTLGLKFDF